MTDLDMGRFGDFMGEFSGESDRGAAVLIMCIVEERLRLALTNRLNGDKAAAKDFAPTMNRLCRACEVLGVISSAERHDLMTLASIRNDFAHEASAGLTFESPSIKGKVGELRVVRLLATWSEPATSRWEFTLAAAILNAVLSFRMSTLKPIELTGDPMTETGEPHVFQVPPKYRAAV